LIDFFSIFIESALTTQDELITSLKTGQELMDLRMTTVTDNVQRQMDAMNQSLVNLQHTLLRLAVIPEEGLSQKYATATSTQDTIIMGTHPVPLEELGKS